jgi:hypothetical protein
VGSDACEEGALRKTTALLRVRGGTHGDLDTPTLPLDDPLIQEQATITDLTDHYEKR